MSDTIQRYYSTANQTFYPMEADHDGNWVKHADHLAALAAKDADIEMLRAMYSRAEQEAAALRMAIEISVMRLLDGTEPREVAKGLCATLAAESEAARAGGG